MGKRYGQGNPPFFPPYWFVLKKEKNDGANERTEKKKKGEKKNNWKKARSITIDTIHVDSKKIFVLFIR